MQQWAPASAITETGHGDAALVVADDPIALAQMARHMIEQVYAVPGQPLLRAALHYGPVQTRQRIVFSNALFPSSWHPEHDTRQV